MLNLCPDFIFSKQSKKGSLISLACSLNIYEIVLYSNLESTSEAIVRSSEAMWQLGLSSKMSE